MIPFKDNIPTDTTPFVTLALIAANVVFYVVAALHGGSLISGPDAQELAKYGAIPAALTWDRVFTSMFMHASILQLVGNMAFLWWFGNTIEDAVGAVRFFGIYLVGGVCAVALQVAVDPDSTATVVGAGGAIATVLGGYTVLYRGARVLTLVLIPLPDAMRLLEHLADALEDAGCNNRDILEHCRQPAEHVRGCWVVDLLLGKE